VRHEGVAFQDRLDALNFGPDGQYTDARDDDH
jgi:hypothetical protein